MRLVSVEAFISASAQTVRRLPASAGMVSTVEFELFTVSLLLTLNLVEICCV